MKRIWKKHIGLLIVGSVICILQMITITKAQLIKGEILNEAISQKRDSLFELIIILVAITVISVLLAYTYGYLGSRFTQASIRSLREAFFKSILDRSYTQVKDLPEGEIIAKYTKQISELEKSYFSILTSLANMAMKIIFVLIALIQINVFLAFASFIILLLPIIVPRLFEKRVSKAQKKRVAEAERHISGFASWLKGFEIIKNYGIEKIVINKFNSSNEKLLKCEEKAENIVSAGMGVSFGSSMVAKVCIAAIASLFVLEGKLNAGDFLAIMSLVAVISVPLYWVAKIYQEVIATGPTRESLCTFIWKNIENKKEGDVVLATSTPLKVEYKNVSFEYKKGEPLIEDLSISLKAGGHYLVTGPSGCGKSTAMNLILGYFEPSKGEVLIDGRRVHRIKELYKKITVCRQEAQLFEDTIRNNLTMHDSSISDKDLIEVLNKVGLGRFASKEAMNQIVLEEGGNLSGGEKKRLSLARALIRKAPIMIFDEPLANVDPENVGKIEDLLLSIKNSTVIIISHQFSVDKLNKFNEVIEIERRFTNEAAMV